MFWLIILVLLILKATVKSLNTLWNLLIFMVLIPYCFLLGTLIGMLLKYKDFIYQFIN